MKIEFSFFISNDNLLKKKKKLYYVHDGKNNLREVKENYAQVWRDGKKSTLEDWIIIHKPQTHGQDEYGFRIKE